MLVLYGSFKKIQYALVNLANNRIVVAVEIAEVDVDVDKTEFRPCMNGQVTFTQAYDSRKPGRGKIVVYFAQLAKSVFIYEFVHQVVKAGAFVDGAGFIGNQRCDQVGALPVWCRGHFHKILRY